MPRSRAVRYRPPSPQLDCVAANRPRQGFAFSRFASLTAPARRKETAPGYRGKGAAFRARLRSPSALPTPRLPKPHLPAAPATRPLPRYPPASPSTLQHCPRMRCRIHLLQQVNRHPSIQFRRRQLRMPQHLLNHPACFRRSSASFGIRGKRPPHGKPVNPHFSTHVY